jgi:hypothetical protein
MVSAVSTFDDRYCVILHCAMAHMQQIRLMEFECCLPYSLFCCFTNSMYMHVMFAAFAGLIAKIVQLVEVSEM